MNLHVEGRELSIGPCRVFVDQDGVIRVTRDSRPVRAGDGFAAAIASRLGLPEGPEHAISVDQTNLSIIVGDTAVIKIAGYWGVADRASILLTALTDAKLTTLPPCLGSVEWTHPDHGTTTLALATGLLPNSADGWTWAPDDLLTTLRTGAALEWPALLGTGLAQLHLALAEAFGVSRTAPSEPWIAESERWLNQALAVTGGPAGVRLANRTHAIRAGIRSLNVPGPHHCISIHGDLHLGQILHTPTPPPGASPYQFIDFDGDPQLPVAQRSKPDSPARDLAHLLVSCDLAAAVAMKRAGGVQQGLWPIVDAARSQLLTAYRDALHAGGQPDLLDERLLPGFCAEQYLRELSYASRYLPEWAYAPDAALTHRFPTDRPDQEEPTWSPPSSPQTSN